jgi:hypothetical protein
LTAPLWEGLFQHATRAQQQELLALAQRQGVLYASQVPPAQNGSTPDRNRPLLHRLLAGNVRDLEPVRSIPLAVSDPALDEIQRDAVSRALATPDVCLIQGLPGTGKSRVAVEILTQAAARGERVLLLAPTPAPVDRVLEAVADRPGVCPIRCLARDESIERLPAPIRALTLLERLHLLRDETLPRARAEVTAAADRGKRLQQDEAVWPRLLQLGAQLRELAERRALLEVARGRIDADVEHLAAAIEGRGGNEAAGTPFEERLRGALRTRDGALARVTDDLAKNQARAAEAGQEQEVLKNKLAVLRPMAEARKDGRWWTGAWWRSRLAGDVLEQTAELEASLARVHAELQALGQQKQTLLAEQERENERYAAARAEFLEAERRRRHNELTNQETALQRDEQLLDATWQTTCKQLQPETRRPGARELQAIEEARLAWQQALAREQEEAVFAEQWAACLEEAADSFPQRLLGLANLVAATTTSLASDPYYGDAAAGRISFDLLVLEDADQVTESEFLAMARRARRCVLIGQPVVGSASPTLKAGRASLLRPGVFQRLWQQLHCDPRRLPYAWISEKRGLCCQLRPLTPEQSQWLESEPLADSPDIELRILTMPRAEPLLAEVVFPASMSIQQAKEYIYRELEELPVQTAGCGVRWVEEDDRIVFRLGDVPASGACSVALAPGVREMLHQPFAEGDGRPSRSSSWRTCGVEFERSAGWSRQRAEEWVEQHLGLRDLGRTVRLEVPHRMRRDLALFLSDLLFNGEYQLPATSQGAGSPALVGAAVEFVPVPCLPENSRQSAGAVLAGQRVAHGRGRSGQGVHTANPPRRGGAGLELDLADVRHRDRLPTEFRAALPDAGLVNYLEAQAVVQTLEALAAEAAERRSRISVSVIALYPGQVVLIRRLLQQARSTGALNITVDVPTAFREREADVVLVSLTRSHGHRAVAFGDGPVALALALTRAREKLYIFGDVGTLARRSQWHNPLDHLDEGASAREHALITQIVAYVQGQGSHPSLFQLREGSTV